MVKTESQDVSVGEFELPGFEVSFFLAQCFLKLRRESRDFASRLKRALLNSQKPNTHTAPRAPDGRQALLQGVFRWSAGLAGRVHVVS